MCVFSATPRVPSSVDIARTLRGVTSLPLCIVGETYGLGTGISSRDIVIKESGQLSSKKSNRLRALNRLFASIIAIVRS